MFDPGIFCIRHGLDNLMSITMPDDITAVVSSQAKVGAFWVYTSALLDSGATRANYVSSAFMLRHWVLLNASVKTTDSYVTLADGVTRIPITQRITLPMRFGSGRKQVKEVSLLFNVLDMTNYDLIVGLPDIRRHLVEVFIREVLKAEPTGQSRLTPTLQLLSDLPALHLPTAEELIAPWTTLTEVAEEHDLEDSPTNFSEPLLLLMHDVETRKAEYLASIEEHVASEFLSVPGARDFLVKVALQTFVHSNWEGVKNADGTTYEVRFEWSTTMPDELRCRPMYVSPKLIEVAKAEYERLCSYHLQRSTSPWASPLVIAPKATHPMVRLVGDYRRVNGYIMRPNTPITIVRDELQRMLGFTYFADLDMTNGFHQFRLSPEDSRRLAIKTPWALVEPRFMPEGVSPATFVLHDFMRDAFRDMVQVIVIFDNILLMAKSQQELLTLMETFFARCRERNIHLKFAKSYIGYRRVKFFGYEIEDGKYSVGKDRIEALVATPFPANAKAMRSFLGASLFCEFCILDYSTFASPLHEMCAPKFPYHDESQWKQDYRERFEALKGRIKEAVTLHFPDYSLTWILRTDASERGVAGVLYQVRDTVFEPIYVISKKLSEPASRWSTYQTECFAIFYSCKKLHHWLMGKAFYVETDHANLTWMEQSLQPSIIRQRLFLQSLNIIGVFYLKQRDNVTQDFYSRYGFNMLATLLAFNDTKAKILGQIESGEVQPNIVVKSLSPDDVLKSAHNARVGHWGIRRTWLNIIRDFPGANIRFQQVADFIHECPVCQKIRNQAVTKVPQNVRSLNYKAGYRRTRSIDLLELERDANGCAYVTVIVNTFSHSIRLYPQRARPRVRRRSRSFPMW